MVREPQDGDMTDAGSGEDFGPWYDSQTGQQFARLPMQPISFQKYARRGWIPGIAPIALQAKWEAGTADRRAANEALVAKNTKTAAFKKLKGEVETPSTDAEAAAEAAADKVIDKLVKLGIIKVPVKNEIDQETEAVDPTEVGNQLKLL